MSPDDPRHGERAGYYAHRKAGQEACPPCKRAAARANNQRVLALMYGLPTSFGDHLVRRRIQALVAIGWTHAQIGERAGVRVNYVQHLERDPYSHVRAKTVERFRGAYNDMCMVTPPESFGSKRARKRAARLGYAPPLAWDNIDDPAEKPHGWPYIGGTRAEQLADLHERGYTIGEVCTRLGVERSSLQRWCNRHGHGPLFNELVRREREAVA